MGAPPENRENLLKELETFAFRGIPNLTSPRIPENLHNQDFEKQVLDPEDTKPVSTKIFCRKNFFLFTI